VVCSGKEGEVCVFNTKLFRFQSSSVCVCVCVGGGGKVQEAWLQHGQQEQMFTNEVGRSLSQGWEGGNGAIVLQAAAGCLDMHKSCGVVVSCAAGGC